MSDNRNNKPQRLGKGLEALIPKTFLSSGKTLSHIPVSAIKPNPFQPRKHFDPEAIQSLADSIAKHGLAQPILVRRKEGYYELIAGERRYRACIMAKVDIIPAIVREASDEESLKLALIENMERRDLNPIEEARAYERLGNEFKMTHQEIAAVVGKSRSAISNTLRLLHLPEPIQQALIDGQVSGGHARALLSLKDENEMIAQLEKLLTEGGNVRQLEEQVSRATAASKKNKRAPGQIGLFQQMEEELSQQYQSRFRIKGTPSSGTIEIKFSSKEQLEKLYELLKYAGVNV